ncbi:MAG: PAS domain S-box protein, partial [Deltaproteobacteria bacterium]|nr:PAS domain S-box protein [Deltaproteobacteria bacterium]
MADQSIQDKYFSLLKAYIAMPQEEHLAEAWDLGRELVMTDIPAEEIIEIHQEMLGKLAQESPDMKLLDASHLIFAPLMEMFMAYSLAFREQLDIRKRVEEALRESEKFSSSLLSNSPNPIMVINPDTSVRYINPAFERLTGFSSTELTGRKFPYPWWTEETLQKTSSDFKEALGNGAQKIEELFQKKNGGQFWVEITSTPVTRNGEFKYYLENWVDITDRKRAEEELRKYRVHLEKLVEERTAELIRANEQLQQ